LPRPDRPRAHEINRGGITMRVFSSARMKDSSRSAQIPAAGARERDRGLIRARLDRDWPRIRERLAARAQ
jgi:hypothetical protein